MMKTLQEREFGPSRRGWALLLIMLLTAVLFRFWQLGNWPPGLYHDEAMNGLDALGVLDGRHPLFFTANNGREPAYIYLTALFVGLLGRSATAVRLGAAVVGSLTTWLVYRLGRAWFGSLVGWLAGWLWAVTLWPVHLSRIGFRTILLVPALTAVFWVGTLAYRRQNRWLWLLAGLLYGLSFYTYLAARFTPILLAVAAFYLYLLLKSHPASRLTSHAPRFTFFFVGTAVVLAPLLTLPVATLLGRTGQVSILNPAINGGDLWGTLARQTGAALGLFFWRGDTILRHNPAGRPLFDLFMLIPFLVGLGWCLRNWRRPAAGLTLLWTAVMLGPTILAEDAPHFLRAVGILPAALLLPAIGLAQIWQWPKLPARWRQMLVVGLALASLGMTVRDYAAYARSPETGYLFEEAARELAETVNAYGTGTAVYVDGRYRQGWPSVPFLITNDHVRYFTAAAGLSVLTPPAVVIAWPYASRDFIPAALPEHALIFPQTGPLAKTDLEPAANPLYVKYVLSEPLPGGKETAVFGEQLILRDGGFVVLDGQTIQADLVWEANTAVPQPLTAFIHVIANGEIIAQSDAPPGGGNWPPSWWQPGRQLHDRHTLTLPEPFDPNRHQIVTGWYDPATLVRLPVADPSGNSAGDVWEIEQK